MPVLLIGIGCFWSASVRAETTFTPIQDLPGGTVTTTLRGISNDGSVAVGQSNSTSGAEGFIWRNGVLTGLGDLPGGTFSSIPLALSADGSIVVGYSASANSTSEAFRWENGVMTALGDLAGGGFNSRAYGISADGLVIVGSGTSAAGQEAVRWENGVMTSLGDLPGATVNSVARAISSDGSVIVGQGNSANGFEAFRWESGVMTALGDLAGGIYNSIALTLNSNGTVVGGWGRNASGQEAFRWENGVMVGLGDLAGGTYLSQVTAMNADGSVLLGYSNAAIGDEAVRWTEGAGWTTGGEMKTLVSVLSDAGVDMTGWRLTGANATNDVGNIIAGSGSLNGVSTSFIANLATGGVTTPEELAAGLVAASAPIQQAQGALATHTSQSLFATANAISSMSASPRSYGSRASSMDTGISGGDDYTATPYLWSGYAVGSFGIGQNNDHDNWDINGTTGIVMQAGDELALGAGILGGTGHSDLPFGGESRVDVKGVSVLAAYEARNGLRFYGTGFAADITGEIERHYANGAGISGSRADTDGIGYGGAARGGWEFPVTSETRVMPYGEIEYTKTKTDAYTETGGAFPASYSKQDGTQITTRFGLQVEQDVTPEAAVGVRAAWAHRVRDENSGLSVSTTGFTGTLGGGEGDRDWAEGAVFTTFALSPTASFGAELSGRTNDTKEPQAALTVGVTFKF